MIPGQYFFMLSALLFVSGLFLIMTRKHAIGALMGIELMLNAANINLIAFSRTDTAQEGWVLALLILIVAAAESAIALAIILQLYDQQKTVQLDELNDLKN
jgi:NADH-quinone oxidoreductase subunit K